MANKALDNWLNKYGDYKKKEEEQQQSAPSFQDDVNARRQQRDYDTWAGKYGNNDLVSNYGKYLDEINKYSSSVDAYSQKGYSTWEDYLNDNTSAYLAQRLNYLQGRNDFFNDRLTRAGNTDYSADNYRQVSDYLSGLRNNLNSINDYWKQFDPYPGYSDRADFAEKSAYKTTKTGDPEYVLGTKVSSGYGDLRYDLINGDKGALQQWGQEDPLNQQNVAAYQYLTDYERKIYNYIYSTEGKEAADAYFDKNIMPRLNAEDRAAETEKWRRYAEEKPVAASALSVLMSPLKGVSYLGQAASLLSNGEIDQNSSINRFSYIPSAVRGEVAGNIKDWLEEQTGGAKAFGNLSDSYTKLQQIANVRQGKSPFDKGNVVEQTLDSAVNNVLTSTWGDVGSAGYQTGMSMLDFMLNAMLTGTHLEGSLDKVGLSSDRAKDAAEWASLLVMGTGAAADTVMEAKDRGMSDVGSFAIGTIAGIAEVLTEKVSVEALMSTTADANMLASIMKNAFPEGMEEVGSDLINWSADAIFSIITKEPTKFREDMSGYLAQGLSESEAFAKVIADRLLEGGQDFLGGAVSGGILGGIQGLQVSNFQNNLGKYINYTGGLQNTLDNASKYGQNSEIYRLAQEIQRKGNVNSRDVGRLAQLQEIEKESMREADELLNSKDKSRFNAKKILENQYARNELGLSDDATVKQARDAMSNRTETSNIAERFRTEALGERTNAMIVADRNRVKEFAETLGKSGAYVMQKVYSAETQDGIKFLEVATPIYNAAIKGEAFSYKEGYITPLQAKMIYEAGENDSLKGEQNEGAVSVSEGVGRVSDQSTGIQSSGLEEGTGQSKAWRLNVRSADRGVSKIAVATKEISAQSVGAEFGTDANKVREVVGGFSPKMTKAIRTGKKYGVNVHLFVGNDMSFARTVEDANGNEYEDKFKANGFVAGDEVWVRADDPEFTADLIAGHEITHKRVEKGEIDVAAVWEQLSNNLTAEQIDRIAEYYTKKFRDSNGNQIYSPERLREEIVCDAMGGMNLWLNQMLGQDVQEIQAGIRATVKENAGKTSESKSQETKYSRVEAAMQEILSAHEEVYKNDDESLRIAATAITQLREDTDFVSAGGDSDIRKNPGGIRTVGRKYAKGLVKTGGIDLRGQKVSNTYELAKLCQIFRNPLFETMRYIFVRNGEVVACTAISSRMASFTNIFPGSTKGVVDLVRRARRTGADTVYIMHNHPSGNPTPSKYDIDATKTQSKWWAKNRVTFGGHVIVDHKTYSTIDRNGNVERKSLPGKKGKDPIHDITPAVGNDLLGSVVLTPNAVAEIGAKIVHDPRMTAVVFCGADGTVREISEVPNDTIVFDKQFGSWVRNQSVENGASLIFAYTVGDRMVFETLRQMVRDGYFHDVALKENEDVWDAYRLGDRYNFDFQFGKETTKYPTYVYEDVRFTEESPAQLNDASSPYSYEAATRQPVSFSIVIENDIAKNAHDAAVRRLLDPKPFDDAHAELQRLLIPAAQKLVGKFDKNGMPLIPEEKDYSNNIFGNASYGLSAEPTTECYRQMAFRQLVKMVTDKLGRPLSNTEALIVNQAAVEIAIDPPCIYCFSKLDRSAREAYKIQYINERTAFEKMFERDYGENREALLKDIDKQLKDEPGTYYRAYLNNGSGRTPSKDKLKRVRTWMEMWAKGIPGVTMNDVRNVDAESEAKDLFKGIHDKTVRDYKLESLKDTLYWAQSSSQAKKYIPYSAYTNGGKGNILKWTKKRVDFLNSEYGLRWYSHSDFHPAFAIDNIQQVIDASVLGLKGLMYCKPIAAAKIMAPTGMNINVSCFAQFKDGQYVMDDKLGANWDEVQQLREEHKNVGAVMVVTNDDMLLWALTRDWVDVVIPLHRVRAGKELFEEFDLTDYTTQQADRLAGAEAKKLYDEFLQEYARQNDLSAKEFDQARKKMKSIYPAEHQNSYERYMERITERGLTPRFDRIRQGTLSGSLSYDGIQVTPDMYMKLVNETRQSDEKTQPLRPVFGWEAALDAVNSLEEQGYFKYFKDASEWLQPDGTYKHMTLDSWRDQALADIKAGKKPNELGYGRDLAINKDGQYVVTSEEAKQAGVHGIHFSRVTDSEGNRLSEGQAEFFKDSKAVDENGRLLALYHGTTSAGFNTFESSSGIIWLTTSKRDADAYGGNPEGKLYDPNEDRRYSVRIATIADLVAHPRDFKMADIKRAYDAYDTNNAFGGLDFSKQDYIDALKELIEEDPGAAEIEFRTESKRGKDDTWVDSHRTYMLYANATNPMIVDLEGAPMNSSYRNGYRYVDDFKNSEYDSLIIKNTKVGRYKDPSTIVIVRNSNQLALTTNENPTSNPDIRFSRVSDDEYMAAVDANDEESLNAMVRAAANESGFDSPLLMHGTSAFGFTEFDLARGEHLIFATTNEENAKTYSGETNRKRISEASHVDADSLSPNELLEYAQKQMPKYKEYHLMSKEEQMKRFTDALNRFDDIVSRVKELIPKLDGTELYYYEQILEALAKVEKINPDNDDAYWDLVDLQREFDQALWEYKFSFEEDSLYARPFILWASKKVGTAFKEAEDMHYSGSIYVNDHDYYKYVYDNQLVAEVNGRLHRGVYKLYGRMGNSLTVDCDGSNWNSIPVPEKLHMGVKVSRTRAIAGAAFAMGYDSVVFKNVRDNGGATDADYNGLSDVYVFNAKNAVKSADPVTYDEDGNVIPLSERFNRKNNDIRFSRVLKAEEKRDAGEKLTEPQFYSVYSAHKLDMRGQGNIDGQIQKIKSEGFKGTGGFTGNLMPTNISYKMENGKRMPANVSADRYAPRKGDRILLVPRSGVNQSTDSVKLGYKPMFDYEIVTADYDYQPYYEMYSKAYDASKKETKYSRVLPENADETAKKVVDSLYSKAKLNDQMARYGMGPSAAYTDERIQREIDMSYAEGDRNKDYAQAYIAFMKPEDFIQATSTDSFRDNLYEEVKEGAKGKESLLDLEKLANESQSMFLNIDGDRIIGHEGRHRMIGLESEGYRYVPVIIWPRQYGYPEGQNRYNTKPISVLRLRGQQFGNGKGSDIFVHDILPLSANYADIAKDVFAGGNNVTKFNRVMEDDALSQENRELKQEMSKLKAKLREKTKQAEYWKREAHVSDEPTLDADTVKGISAELLKSNASAMSLKDTTERVNDICKKILTEAPNNDDWYQSVREDAMNLASDMNAQSKILTDDREYSVKDFREYFKSHKVYVTPSARSEVAPDGWDRFRKSMFGTMTFTNEAKGISVDQLYQDMRADFGDWLFPEDITAEADQMNKILEVVESYKPVYDNRNSYEAAMANEWAADEILTRIMGAFESGELRQSGKTRADKLQEKLNNQREYTQRALKKVRESRDAREAALKEHYQEMAERRRTRKEDSELRTKLLNIARRVRNMKLGRVAGALRDQILGDLDLAAKSITKQKIADLTALEYWYEQEKARDNDFYQDPDIEKQLKRLHGKHISDLTQEEVISLTNILLNFEFENRLKESGMLINSAVKTDRYVAGMTTVGDIRSAKGKPNNPTLSKLNTFFVDNMLNAEREVRRLTAYHDDDPLLTVTREIIKGYTTKLDYMMKAMEMMKPFVTDKKLTRELAGKHARELSVTGAVGMKTSQFAITPAKGIELYLASMNDDNMRHIAQGGILVPDIKEYKKGHKERAYDLGQLVKFTRSAIQEVSKQLTDKEKAFANAIYRYYNSFAPNAINNVSEDLVGFAKAMVHPYFPIATLSTFLGKDFGQVKEGGDPSSMGFMQERQVDAKNPIVLADVTETLMKSIDENSTYVGLAIPIRNFNLLTKTVFSLDGTISTIKDALKQRWGQASLDYIEKMINDVQGKKPREKSVFTDIVNMARSNQAKAALYLTIGVAIKQAASLPTAAATIGAMPILKALRSLRKVDPTLIRKYSPLYEYRQRGYSDPELGDIGKSKGDLPKLLKWIETIDLWTIRRLWRASEFYVRKKNPELDFGTEEFYTAVKDVWERVVHDTQPNYTPMERPQALRTTGVERALHLFKTQPYQNFGILYDALGNLLAKHRQFAENANEITKENLKEAKVNFARAVGSQFAASFVFSAMQFVVDLLRGKTKKYKDDDEDEITLLSWMKAMGINMLGNGFGMVPLGNVMLEVVESITDTILKATDNDPFFNQSYYGISEPAIEAINTGESSVINFVKKISSVLSGDSNAETFTRDMVSLGNDVAGLAGVPSGNITRSLQSLARLITKGVHSNKLVGDYYALRITTDPVKYRADYYDLLYKAYKTDTEAYREIYNDMLSIDDGNTFDQDKIKAAMEDRMKKDAGVNSVKELPNRWRTPEQVEQAEKEVGLTDEEYRLYELALKANDKPNSSGNLGTYTNEEVEAAIRSVAGLTDAERDYLWLAAGKKASTTPDWSK